jgi:hypothetical protein
MADPNAPAPPAADVNPYTGQPAAMAIPPVEKVVSDRETKTFADWMVHAPALVDHEKAFRAVYGPSADQMMDMATLNARLLHMGIELIVEPLAAPPAPPPGTDPNAPAPNYPPGTPAA